MFKIGDEVKIIETINDKSLIGLRFKINAIEGFDDHWKDEVLYGIVTYCSNNDGTSFAKAGTGIFVKSAFCQLYTSTKKIPLKYSDFIDLENSNV